MEHPFANLFKDEIKAALIFCYTTLGIKSSAQPAKTFEITHNGKNYPTRVFKETNGEPSDFYTKPYAVIIEINVNDVLVKSDFAFATSDIRDAAYTIIDAEYVQELINDTYIAEIIDSALED